MSISVVEQGRDAVGFLDRVFERRAIAIHVGRRKQGLFGPATNPRDGCPQVVGDGVQRVAHAGDQVLDAAQHGVGHSTQFAQDVALLADGHPSVQPARLRDLAQRVEQVTYRSKGLPRQCAAADQADHHHNHQQRTQQRAHVAQEPLPFERGAPDLEQCAVGQALGGHLESDGRPARRHDAPALASSSCSSAYDPQLAGMLVSRISALVPTRRTNTWSSLPDACSAATARPTPPTPAVSKRPA